MRRHHWWLAAAAASAAAIAGLGADGLPVVVAAPVLAEIAWTDQTTHRIPNRLLLAVTASLIVTLGLLALADRDGLGPALMGTALWGGALLAVHLVDPRLGFGDVKLAGPLGAQAGWVLASNAPDGVTWLCLCAGILLVGCVLALTAARGERGATAFAPWLVVAAWLAPVAAFVGT